MHWCQLQRITLFVALLALWLPAHGSHADIETYSPAEISQLEKNPVAPDERYRTTGTVIWRNPYWRNCVIADESNNQGVMVAFGKSNERIFIEVGQTITVEGTLVLWESHTGLDGATYEIVGPGQFVDPVPVPRNLDVAGISSLDCQRVTVEGRVSFVNQHFNRHFFWIDGYDVPIRAEFRDPEGEAVGVDFTGAVVKATGVVYQRGMSKEMQGWLLLMMNSASDIEILERPPRWKTDAGGHGIHGTIVSKKSDTRYFFRTDNEAILDLEIDHELQFDVGNKLQIVGTQVVDDGNLKTIVSGLELYDAPRKWMLKDTPQLIRPLAQHQTGDLVRIDGTTSVQIQEELDQGWFTLTSEYGETMRVDVSNLDDNLEILQLDTASGVEIVGYLDKRADTMRVYPSNVRNIKVTQRGDWHWPAWVKWLGLGILVTLVTSLGCIVFLRHAVKSRARDLEDSAGLLTSSYDAILEGICLIDDQGTIQKANPRFWTLLDLDPKNMTDLRGDALRDHLANCFVRSKDFVQLWNDVRNEKQDRKEFRLEHKTGPAEHLSVYTVGAQAQRTGNALGQVWVFHDLTEKRRLEKSLLQAQKMEAVGRLAGGIAHDFNNMLAGISGNLAIAKMRMQERSPEAGSCLDAAEYGVGRAAELVKSLLGFSRQSILELKPGSANEVIQALMKLLKPTLDPKLKLEADMDADLGLAEIDVVKLEQVLLNMVVNARDAMPPEGGVIHIRTRNVQSAENAGDVPIDCVEIEVTDTGAGMTTEVIANIFDPFYSTKGAGEGTGLGLSTSLGVIQQLGGWITCDSERGRGTSFHIYLPRIPAQPDLQQKSTELVSPLSTAHSGIRVLCVDDEIFVLRSATALLESMGFETLSAKNGEEALELLASTVESGGLMPDVVMLDKAMPVLSGVETLPILRERYPDLPVIMCSGFLVDREEFIAEAGATPDAFVQKPYRPQELQEVLKKVVVESKDPIGI